MHIKYKGIVIILVLDTIFRRLRNIIFNKVSFMLAIKSVGNGFITNDIFQIKLVLTSGVKNQKNFDMAIILILQEHSSH